MSAGRPPALRRVLLYSHDTFGLGHLRRNLAIATHLLQCRPGLQVVLMTGSTVAGRFPLPCGLTLVRLPPVVKVGAEQYRARDDRFGIELVRRTRSAIMVDAARRFEPDVLLVDHSPLGMRGELLPVLGALRSAVPQARVVLGLRDVLDDPAVVRRTWEEQRVHDTLRDAYDRVLVYGSPDILDVVGAYRIPPDVAAKVVYTGYVCPPARLSSAPRRGGDEASVPLVLGTAGGGGDGAATLAATLQAGAALGVRTLVVTGPLMAEAERHALHALAASDPRATVTEFVPDLAAAAAGAAAVVTMGGYNTLCELVRAGTPTVVVPRVEPRREQAIRAALFARRGVVSVVEPGPELAARLRRALALAMAGGRRRGPAPIPLDGLDAVDAALRAEAAGEESPAAGGAGPVPARAGGAGPARMGVPA